MKLLTKADLDAAGCASPDCKHDHSVLYLASECHPEQGLAVRYDKKAGAIIIMCAACQKEVVRIAPAEHGVYQ